MSIQVQSKNDKLCLLDQISEDFLLFLISLKGWQPWMQLTGFFILFEWKEKANKMVSDDQKKWTYEYEH